MASVPISKTDLRNIILQLGNYISLGGEVTAPTEQASGTKSVWLPCSNGSWKRNYHYQNKTS